MRLPAEWRERVGFLPVKLELEDSAPLLAALYQALDAKKSHKMAHLLAFQKKRALIQLILWPLEATVGFTLFGLARLLPVGAASALMGWLLSSLAPLTPWQARARRNLAYALPDIDSAEQDRILAGMWNNLGRVIGEYPHVGRLDRLGRVEFVGLDHIKHLDSGGFLIGAHIGNWEVGPLAALKVGKQVSAIYRPLNNPLLASLLERRQMAYGGDIYRKGREAALGMVASVRKGQMMCLLVDQQLREGHVYTVFWPPGPYLDKPYQAGDQKAGADFLYANRTA